MRKPIKLVPPHGGWRWILLCGIAVNNIFNMSMLSVFSLLYGDVLESMGYRTKGAALVLNTAHFISIFSGPIAGAMVKLTSPRLVAVTGACTCTLAIFFSAFSTNIWHLVITYGVLGFGLDFIALSSFVVIDSYFTSRKTRALGLVMIGSSVGQILMPHVVKYLLEAYGYRGTCLLLSSLSFHGVAGCMLIQPVEVRMKKVESEKPLIESPEKTFADITQNDNVINEIVQSDYGVQESSKQLIEANPLNEKANQSKKESSMRSNNCASSVANSASKIKSSFLRKFLDLSVITPSLNLSFINIAVGIALCNTSIFNFGMLYPLFLEKKLLFDKHHTANCMSTVAVADLVGRFIIPSFQDKCKIKARWVLISICIWLIFTRQILAYQNNFKVMVIFSALYGFGRSTVVVQRDLVISEHCNKNEVPVAIGFSKLVTGVVTLPLGYFLGWIRDYTGSYIACISAQNVLLGILLLIWLPDMIYTYVNKSKKTGRITYSRF